MSHLLPSSMKPSPQTAWCTKKQVAKIIGRSERTVSRILRKAIDNRTTDLLVNMKLVYKDGKETAGTKVTVAVYNKNEREKIWSRWYFRVSWWTDVYATELERSQGQQDEENQQDAESRSESSTERGATSDPAESAPPLPKDPNVRAVVLEHLHYNDQKHAVETSQLMDRVLLVVQTNQRLQGQTNELLNEFQDALKQGGGLRALIAAGAPSNDDLSSNSEHRKDPIEAQNIQTDQVESEPTKENPKSMNEPQLSVADKYLPTFKRFSSRMFTKAK